MLATISRKSHFWVFLVFFGDTLKPWVSLGLMRSGLYKLTYRSHKSRTGFTKMKHSNLSESCTPPVSHINSPLNFYTLYKPTSPLSRCCSVITVNKKCIHEDKVVLKLILVHNSSKKFNFSMSWIRNFSF